MRFARSITKCESEKKRKVLSVETLSFLSILTHFTMSHFITLLFFIIFLFCWFAYTHILIAPLYYSALSRYLIFCGIFSANCFLEINYFDSAFSQYGKAFNVKLLKFCEVTLYFLKRVFMYILKFQNPKIKQDYKQETTFDLRLS